MSSNIYYKICKSEYKRILPHTRISCENHVTYDFSPDLKKNPILYPICKFYKTISGHISFAARLSKSIFIPASYWFLETWIEVVLPAACKDVFDFSEKKRFQRSEHHPMNYHV